MIFVVLHAGVSWSMPLTGHFTILCIVDTSRNKLIIFWLQFSVLLFFT